MKTLSIFALAVFMLSLTHDCHGIRCHECVGAAGPLGADNPDIQFFNNFLRYPILNDCSIGKKSNSSVECPEGWACGKDYYEFDYKPEPGTAGMTIRGCTSLEEDEDTNTCTLNYSRGYLMRIEGKQEAVNPLELWKKFGPKSKDEKQNPKGIIAVNSCVCESDDCNKGVGSEVYRPVSSLTTGFLERMLNQM